MPEALLAGAAQVEITPQAGVHLSGDIGAYRPAQVVLDPLYARVLVLESGAQRLCLVGLDVTIITAPWTERIRQQAASLGFPPEAVMVHATQTHSAPGVGHFMLDEDFPAPPELEWLRGGETPYAQQAVAGAAAALRLACSRLQPVSVAAGSALRDGLAHNRRGITREGGAIMPWLYSSRDLPLGPTNLRCLEGPTDPEVGVVCLRSAQGRLVAMLLHFSCHPVNVFAQPPNLVVSADWPGAWAAQMGGSYGQDCVFLVINGCCGNLNPWPAFQPDFFPDHRRMGRELAETADRVVRRLAFREGAALDCRVRQVPLPVRELQPPALDQAAALLREHPTPIWTDESKTRVRADWMSAALAMSVHLMRQREPRLAYQVQAFRIGEVAIVGLPGEPFVEGQLRIKIGSPTYPTYLAHCTNQYVGYLPTREAFPRGGHEVNLSYWSKLAPEALDLAVQAALDLLGELFPG